MSLAQNLLEACGNNLEMAINMHMEGAAGGTGAQTHSDAAVSHCFLSNQIDRVIFPLTFSFDLRALALLTIYRRTLL